MAKFRAKSQNRPVPKLEPRIAILTAAIITMLGLVSVRLYYLQVMQHHEMSELADRNRIRLHRVPAPRGLVFDLRHRPLVDTQPTFDAEIVPEDSPNLSETIERLEGYLGGDDHVADKIAAADEVGRPPYEPVLVAERLDWPKVVALEAHQLELPGVSLEITPGRHYLYGRLAAHLLGYVGEVSREDLIKQTAYHMGDEIGKFGLERGWEPFLRGQSGGQEVEVDAVGRRLRVLKEMPDTPGESVVLTIDLDLQETAERALQGKNGALVALDPNNGDVLAMVSHPAFDPDVFGAGVKSADWRTLMSDPDHPLQNRVIQGTYPPGSTFKVLDSIAGLQEGTLNEHTVYTCGGGIWFGGREFHCWRKHGHGSIALHNAIVRSCDVYFYAVGQHLGVDKLAHWGNLFGFGNKTGVDLDNEKGGVMPSSAWKQKRYHQRWYAAETLSVAIGQGYVAVTPLQLAQFAAMIANGGIRYRPQVVKEVEGLDGGVAKSYPPIVEQRVDVAPDTLAFVRQAMADVVNGAGGTAHKAQLPGITVCAKTGTAQVVGNKGSLVAGEDEDKMPEKYRDHAWLIAFAPKEHPQIAIACLVEHGGHGGAASAPIVREVMQRFFELHPPTPPTPELTEDDETSRPAIAHVLEDDPPAAAEER